MRDQELFLRNAMAAHGDAVYRLALCRTQNPADAEDVYQDVFLRLLRQQAQGWDGEHLKAWLIRTALNRCADLHRFRLRRPTLSLEELPEQVFQTGGTPEQRAELSELWEAVARLPAAMRTVVHLYYGEGCSTEEIATILECPTATVRTRLHRARTKLKDLLGGFDDEQEQVSKADGEHPYPRRAE